MTFLPPSKSLPSSQQVETGMTRFLWYQNPCIVIWCRFEQHPLRFLVSMYVLCLAIFAATIPLPRQDNQLVGSDGAYYYAYLPSLIIDGDLDFTNQYARLLPSQAQANSSPIPSGLPPNQFAVGSAILWLPFFLLAHMLVLSLHAIGMPLMPDGMNYLYQALTLMGSISYGFAGLLLIYRSCCRFFGHAVSVLTTLLIWTATNAIYYMVAEPSMSHMCSLFAVSLFTALWLAARPRPTLRQWAVLGLAGGLVTLVRQPDATFLTLPLLDTLWEARASKITVWHAGPGIALFGTCVVAVFAPQMAVWYVLNGSPFLSGYFVGDRQAFFWLAHIGFKVKWGTIKALRKSAVTRFKL